MRIAFFSTYLFGGAGGSARAIVSTLRNMGHSVQTYYRFSSNEHEHEHCLDFWFTKDQRNKAIHAGNTKLFYLTGEGTSVTFEQVRKKVYEKPDIIVLFWVAQMLTPAVIKQMYDYYQCPIVFFMSDNQVISGGCHYTMGCNRYMLNCGCCPQLDSYFPKDYSSKQLHEKISVFSEIPIHVIAPSSWQIELAKKSAVPFASYFTQCLGLPNHTFSEKDIPEKFSSVTPLRFIWTANFLTESRKGFRELVDSLHYFSETFPDAAKKCSVTIIAKHAKMLDFSEITIPIQTHEILPPKEYEEELRNAHVYLNTSLEDAGPGTLMKAMCKGCIPISFPTGIAPDIVNNKNGYITQNIDYKKFAQAMYSVSQLTKDELIAKSSQTVSLTKEQLDEQKTYENFLAILQQLIDNHKN